MRLPHVRGGATTMLIINTPSVVHVFRQCYHILIRQFLFRLWKGVGDGSGWIMLSGSLGRTTPPARPRTPLTYCTRNELFQGLGMPLDRMLRTGLS